MKRHRPLRSPPSQTTTTTTTTTTATISSFFPSKKPKPISSNLKTPIQTPLKWTPLNLPKSELYLPLTFPTGQTFRWKQTSPFQYTGVIGSHLISLKQHNLKNTHYCIHNLNSTNDDQESVKLALLDFLNMGICLNDLWSEFSACDERFAELAVNLSGARVLRQDPLECLVQFICSSNNNIKRITKMVDFVSCLGEFVGVVEGFEFYKFPSLERLARVTEDELREAGFGYRAKYITGTVKVLQSKPGGGVEWLLSLRKLDLESAIKALTTLPGVGPKVAACIALFSLDQHHAVPVDTHVWKIATRDLLPELAGTRLTPKVCSRVSDAFVEKYGKYAGWAQTLLFIAELPSQKALLQSLTNETKDAVKDEIDELQQSVVKEEEEP
ncbi:8-oxoguanine-DNA glycosylase 1 [Artemisia annua]|uniref:DNA-(apurinic or apyrimidinic site) lyase n=1 Tax=Artemisia annua TaxID=35608 RepID=A0A2U1PIW6_ARTAN|nr:8-oxoguanine-DNA glycosylase 1 [Artemisia annua]